jgi:hypothetical protein
MRASEIIDGLDDFEQRGAGTDAERRAAQWLGTRLQTPGRAATVEPFWSRPNTALAHAWHVALGLAGSLVSVSSPRVGGVMVLVALVSLICDELTGRSLGRRLTFEHASQNVLAAPTTTPSADDVHLIITANYDAGRAGLVHRRVLRSIPARIQRPLNGVAPGWLGWLAILLAWLLATALLRLGGHRGTGIGALQLIPTVALVIALALLIELGSSAYARGAGDNASGVAVAIAIAAALDVAPPRRLTVEVLLQGASDGTAAGLRHHLRTRRRTLRAPNTIVLGIAPSATGEQRWWLSDGPLVPLRYLAQLRRLCAGLAADGHRAHSHRGRGTAPALSARAARLPAITIGRLDDLGLSPGSHTSGDIPDAIDPTALDETVAFGLLLIDAISAYLKDRPPRPAPRRPSRAERPSVRSRIAAAARLR